MKCAFTGKKAGVAIVINPKSAECLAKVCGCSISELPEQMQHFGESIGYTGNNLLDRLDPLSTYVDDPFQELTICITILVSKREYIALCKEAGVEAVKFWQQKMQ